MKSFAGLFSFLFVLTSIVNAQTIVEMQKKDGVYYVPCTVNGLTLEFIFDTGAGDVSISLTEALFMLKNGYMSEDDLIGTEYYRLANGEINKGTEIIIRELIIGDRILNNVSASVVHNLSAPLLLGQSALEKLGNFSVDYVKNIIVFDNELSPKDQSNKVPINDSQNTKVINRIQGSFISNTTATNITLENFLTPGEFSLMADIKDGKFNMEFDCKREDIFKLKIADKNYVALVIKPGDIISLKLNPDALGINPEISGSEQSKRIYDVESQLGIIKKSQDSLNTVYSTISQTDVSRKKQVEDHYNLLEMQKNTMLFNNISSNKGDLVNMFFVERLNIDHYYTLYAAVDSAVYPKYSYNPAVAGLHSKVNSNKVTAVGSKAPEIKLATPEGDTMSLYDIKGKMIVIDFWASWCRPCRMENPNMISLYADYHEKGLEIFGVSLDKDKAAWIKAIADDKLIWHHVSDLKYWQSEAAKLYGVGSIPSMFVLDGDFKIIAKNLRGDQLRAFVASKLN